MQVAGFSARPTCACVNRTGPEPHFHRRLWRKATDVPVSSGNWEQEKFAWGLIEILPKRTSNGRIAAQEPWLFTALPKSDSRLSAGFLRGESEIRRLLTALFYSIKVSKNACDFARVTAARGPPKACCRSEFGSFFKRLYVWHFPTSGVSSDGNFCKVGYSDVGEVDIRFKLGLRTKATGRARKT